MKTLVIGKDGQLGKSIMSVVINSKLNSNFVFIDKKEIDLSDQDSIYQYFNNNNFNIIINCAAFTAVDKAETEKILADQINHLAVKQLANIANKKNIKLIHISTDYVFDGKSNKPYLETDTSNPINVYGITKLAGEKELCNILPNNAIIIRTSWLYSEYGNNFLDTILKLGKKSDKLNIVNDQIGSPTYARDLAVVITHIVNSHKFLNTDFNTQIYHYSNQGKCSWYEFTKEIIRISGTKCSILPIPTKKYPTLAKRPMFTVLSKDKIIENFDIKIPEWRVSLGKCIREIK